MESNRLNTAGNTTGKEDSEKHVVIVLITILSSENSSPFCLFLDGCFCMCVCFEGHLLECVFVQGDEKDDCGPLDILKGGIDCIHEDLRRRKVRGEEREGE